MGADSNIEWCHDTFNPWRGCQRVSPGCEHCYAETLSARNPSVLGTWGPKGSRVVASESYWRQPLAWNRKAERDWMAPDADVLLGRRSTRRRVFCASLADVFEARPDLEHPRARLWDLIRATPNLDWLLLSKRPENFRLMLPVNTLPNVWLGVSVEDQQRADERSPVLLDTPATVRFLSCEPLLGPLDLRPWIGTHDCLSGQGPCWRGFSEELADGEGDRRCPYCGGSEVGVVNSNEPRIDWVIVGGESGPGARPCDVGWVRDIVRQCRAASVPVFVKQLGAKPRSACDSFGESQRDIGGAWEHRLKDRKGGDPAEWPEDLRVREFHASALSTLGDEAGTKEG